MADEVNDIVEDVIPVPDIVETKDDAGNDITDYKALAEEQRVIAEQNRGIAQRNKTRAERFKNGLKPVKVEPIKEPVDAKSTDNLSMIEVKSLIENKVSDEDTSEVLLYARSHNMTVTEALKTPEVKAILDVKAEYRKTAEASNTKASRGSAPKPSDEQILAEIADGKLPDAETLANIRQKQRLEKRTK